MLVILQRQEMMYNRVELFFIAFINSQQMTRPNCSKGGLCYPLDKIIGFPNSYQPSSNYLFIW